MHRGGGVDVSPRGTAPANAKCYDPIERDVESQEAMYMGETLVSLRLAFIRRVYSVLTLQLLLTLALGLVFYNVAPVRAFVQVHRWPLYIAIGLTFVLLFLLFWKRRESPTNVYLLVGWTIAMAYTVAVTTSTYAAPVVLKAVALTLSVVVALTAYTFYSKRDFSFLGAGLFAALWILIIASCLQMFFGIFPNGFHFVYCVVGSVVFSLFIVYDTWRIINVLSLDEWVMGCIDLYLDIINLFLLILDLIRSSQRD